MAIAIFGEVKSARDAKNPDASPTPWVFPTPRKGVGNVNTINIAARPIKADSGVESVPHNLCRTAATYIASMGVPRLSVSRVLNHAEGVVIWIYDGYSYDSKKREALTVWDAQLAVILVIAGQKKNQSTALEASLRKMRCLGAVSKPSSGLISGLYGALAQMRWPSGVQDPGKPLANHNTYRISPSLTKSQRGA